MGLDLREFAPSNAEIKAALNGELHPMALKGIELINAGQYWDAHEALEEAWLKETGTIRALYKGILQAGVMLLQIERKNLFGAVKMYKRSEVWLGPWPERARGIDVQRLKKDVDAAIQAAMALGPDRLAQFDAALYFQVHFA
jgi:hypothetical protein